MHSLRRFSMTCRAWLLPLLLIPFLGTSLVSCFQCEAVAVPTIIPTLWVAGGQVYLYSYGARTLYALRASDGKQLWQADGFLEATEADHIYMRVEPHDSDPQDRSVFLEAHRASSGKLLWRTRQDALSQIAGTSAQSVFLYSTFYGANNMNGTPELTALDASTGSPRWKVPLTAPTLTGVYSNDRLSAQVEAGIVYLNAVAGGISAYNEESGALLWHRSFPSGFNPSMPWFISHGAIYLSADHLYALRARDGATIWQTDPAIIELDPDQNILYTIDNHHLSALRTQDGRVLWTHAVTDRPNYPQIIKLIDGVLYTGAASPFHTPPEVIGSDFDNGVFANRASDGESLWYHQGSQVAVAGAEGTAYLLSYGYQSQQPATLTALRASNGAPLWHQNLASAAGLVYADGALYTGYAGDNLTSGCIATGFAAAAQLRSTDGKQVWHFQAG